MADSGAHHERPRAGSFQKNTLYGCFSIFCLSLIAARCGGIHRNEWRTVSGFHALVLLEANEPRQSFVDPSVNHGFEPDYGFEIFRGIRPTKRVFDARLGFKGFNQRESKVFAHVKERFSLGGF
jgi:hypothetical protein